MVADNLTVVLESIDNIVYENRPIPEPKEGQVLIRMGCVGICGSDVHYVKKGRIGDFIVKEPMVLGHEAAGTVEKLGPGVVSLNVGDRVAIEPGVPCRTCSFCKDGRYHLCRDIEFCATPPVDGNLCRYYVHAADFCYKLPDHVSLEEGALLEPLSVGVHACKKAQVTLGSNVLIEGAGPIGLVMGITAKAMGAAVVIVTDMIERRLTLASQCFADHTLLLKPGESEDSIISRVSQCLNGDLPDKTIDCCGADSTINLGLKATKSGGTFVIVGMSSTEVKLPLVAAMAREINIRGSFRYANDYPVALAMVASGKANVKPLVTHHFKLEESIQAFEAAAQSIGNPVKIIINCE